MARRIAGAPINPVDAHVGARLKALRRAKGWSMDEMAKVLGVAHQQVYKYETGQNRIGPGRMLRASMAFGVPVSLLFSGLEGMPAVTAFEELVLDGARLEILRLVNNFTRIKDAEVRRALLRCIQAFGDAFQVPADGVEVEGAAVPVVP